MAQTPAVRAAASTKEKSQSGKTERKKFCWNVIRFNQRPSKIFLPYFNIFFLFLNQMDMQDEVVKKPFF